MLLLSRRVLCVTHGGTRRYAHSVVVGAGDAEFTIKTGHLARFADSAVVVEKGDTAILATCVTKPSTSDAGFTSLMVDYRQSAAAVGRIPTNYLRRELGQTDHDILTSRAIDRSIRPLIPGNVTDSIQVICKPLAQDDQSDSVVMAINAASSALLLSSVPLIRPSAAVRIGSIDNELILNPSKSILVKSDFNLLLTGCGEQRVLMIEMDGKEVDIDHFEEAIRFGLKGVSDILASMEQLKSSTPKKESQESQRKMKNGNEAAAKPVNEKKLYAELDELCTTQLQYILTDTQHDKISRDNAIRETYNEALSALSTEYPPETISRCHAQLVKKTLRNLVLDSGFRCDGRSLTDFRAISMQVDLYKKLHGSALFQRGQTQVMATCTFDSPHAAFHPDSISQLLGSQRKKMFMLHYEFPGYATNELSTGRSTNRRELGHGVLAEKSLAHVMPPDFPYCIRLACQVLESNGSSSMASVCAGSLAMSDAGVPLTAPAAGVAIGLITREGNEDGEYKVLTDLMGIEDYAGDMDFKIAGTSKGFTAMQMDTKICGINLRQLADAIRAGQDGINRLIEKMKEVLPEPRKEFKDSVPVLETTRMEAFKRQVLFRSGGHNAKMIEAETGVKIFVEDDNHISLTAPNAEQMARAREMIDSMLSETDEINLSFGQMVKVHISELSDRGVMVKITPNGKSIFIPNSQLHHTPIQHPSAIGLKVGDKIVVQWLGRDSQTGHYRISRRVLQSTNAPTSNKFKK